MDRKDDAERADAVGPACRVSRAGEVVRVDTSGLWIRVQGRDIPIAANKVDSSLRLGDRARWNGRMWVSAGAEPEDGLEAAR